MMINIIIIILALMVCGEMILIKYYRSKALAQGDNIIESKREIFENLKKEIENLEKEYENLISAINTNQNYLDHLRSNEE